MSIPIATTGADATQSARDHRIEQYGAGKAQGQATGETTSSPTGGAVLVDVTAAVGAQNAASAATDVKDLDAAQTLMKQLVSQLAAQPSGGAGQSSPSPRAVLSLLS